MEFFVLHSRTFFIHSICDSCILETFLAPLNVFALFSLCSAVLSQEQGQLDGVKMRATDGDADQEGRCPVAGRSICSEAGPPSSHPVSTWSFTPGTHKSPFTSASSLLPAPGSSFSHLPTLAPLPTGTEAMKVPPGNMGCTFGPVFSMKPCLR